MNQSELSRVLASVRNSWRRLMGDRRANVLLLTAVALIPLMIAVGFGIDYARAERSRTRLIAAADAAVLAAVDPSMITQSDAAAQLAAERMFDQQTSGYGGLTVASRTVTISATSSGSLGTLRTASITYAATSTNIFGSFLKIATLPLNGSAAAAASQPPSIDFYIALDTSPSMLLPTTSTGITNLIAGARWNGHSYWWSGQKGCDFACHSNNMHQWNQGTYVIDASQRAIYLNAAASPTIPFFRVACNGTVYNNSGAVIGSNGSIRYQSGSTWYTSATYCSGYGPAANPVTLTYTPTGSSSSTNVSVNFPDTWWLARNYGTVNPGADQIDLRTDAEGDAAAGVIQYAWNLEQQYATANVPPVYRMKFYTFNVGAPAVLGTSPFGTLTDVASSHSASFPDLGAQAPLLAANTYWTSMSQYTGNADTDFTAMFTGMKAAMPTTSGTGTPSSPQNVLILITDGAHDSTTDGMTQLTSGHIAQCTAIKATGTRIAILYTEYLPATINYTSFSTFNNFATNNVPNIQPQLKACASQNADGTYLIQTVSTDGSVSDALNTLFAMTVQSAKLIQ